MFTLTQAADQIRTRKLSPVELTRECLAKIEQLNPTLNSFITVTADPALEQARQAEQEIAAGNYRGPFQGIPIALKDNLDTAGVLTTSGSNQYRERVPREDAEIVRQLKSAGAVIVGKTNMHEFAFGGSGVVSAFGPARNPLDPERVTGGSSSGTAAAVAAGMCVAAIGTDTAGSVRCPAALCGVVGHRPSQGVLSNAGTVPLAESFDTPGPITRTAADARVVLQALSPLGCPIPFEPKVELTKLRVGVVRNLAVDLDADVANCLEATVRTLVPLVAYVEDLKLEFKAPWPVRNFEIFRYHQPMYERTPELYDPRTLERVKGSAGVSELEYVRKKALWKADQTTASIFGQFDVVVSPTVPVVAPLLRRLEAMDSAALRAYEINHLLRNTLPSSVLWWPSISVPCGASPDGLPVGLQISARPGADGLVLAVAEAWEKTAL
jgi:aspartyl-tRNA(Asn)/glutamyl-tRNA(Gln) amidotransferase subunit A